MNQRVLIVDDEEDLVSVLEYNLRTAGYQTLTARTGREALQLASGGVDLVLLDLMLPDLSGIEVCKRLRGQLATASVPVLMLTARGEDIDRVVGFEVGADDYVVKPFSIRELLLRVAVLLRRARPEETTRPEAEEMLRFGPVAIDVASHRAYANDEEIELTPMEFELLKTLVERRGRVQSRAQLLEDVWDASPDLNTRTIDTHINRLRRKLGSAGDILETVRGTGYRLSA
jgi:two-component system phosphate regulon response regulator PhoB